MMRDPNGFLAAVALVALVGLGRADPGLGVAGPMITPAPVLLPRQQQVLAPGQVGIKPIPKESLKVAKIEAHTSFVGTDGAGATTWHKTDSPWVAVSTKTINNLPVTASLGVKISKNAAGGLDVLLSPAVKNKLEAIAKNVPACPIAKEIRQPLNKRQTGCGEAEFLRQVEADPELHQSFAKPATDQIHAELEDEGIGLRPEDDPNWNGDGFPDQDPGANTHFSDDEGFFEGSSTEVDEAFIIATEEEAAVLAATEAAGTPIAGTLGVIGAGSLLAGMYSLIEGGASIPYVTSIPKENVHRITRPKKNKNTTTRKQGTTSSSSSSSGSCTAAATGLPNCDASCSETSSLPDPKATDIVFWACSEGNNKGCPCNPGGVQIADLTNKDRAQAMIAALRYVGGVGDAPPASPTAKPPRPTGECEFPRSPVASKFFPPVFKSFCAKHFSRDAPSGAGLFFDIHGNEIRPKLSRMSQRSPPDNNPDAYIDYRFGLTWSPKSDQKCFDVDQANLCEDAFTKLANSQCGINAGDPNDRLFVEARMDVGCGVVSWTISSQDGSVGPKPTVPRIGRRQCYESYGHPDVHEQTVKDAANEVCDKKLNGNKITQGSKKISWNFNPTKFVIGSAVSNYRVEVSWNGGCADFKEQDLARPNGDKEKGPKCEELLFGNYKACNNGGSGGYIDVGCVRYEFHAQNRPLAQPVFPA